MPSLERIKKEMQVKRTPNNKGWTMTIEVDVYDNGLTRVNGHPINYGLLNANLIIANHLLEFHKAVGGQPTRVKKAKP